MKLELKPVLDEQYESLPPARSGDVPLSIAAIQEFHAELEAYIDKRVAELHKQFPGLPLVMLRRDTIRGQCLCAVATRLLKEPQ